MKLAFWGSGPISDFHVPALRAAGFEIEVAFSRENSDRLKIFCEKHGLSASQNQTDFLDYCSSSDAIFVALKSEVVYASLKDIVKLGKPILAEKPGAVDRDGLRRLRELGSPSIYWAYNRRFYISATELKGFADKTIAVNIVWPETKRSNHQFVINGCHIVDLIHFSYGKFKILSRRSLGENRGFSAHLLTDHGLPITLSVPFGASANAEINAYLEDGKVLHVKPLEDLYLQSGLRIIEPDQGSRIRQYIPEIQEYKSDRNSLLKPGFQDQAEAFLNLVKGSGKGHLASHSEGLLSLELTLDLLET